MKTVRKLLVSLLSLTLLMSVLVVPAFAEGDATCSVALSTDPVDAVAITLYNVDLTDETQEVRVELYNGSDLLTTATLNREKVPEAKVYEKLECYMPLTRVMPAWPYTDWTPDPNVAPTQMKFYVGDDIIISASADETSENWEISAEDWAGLSYFAEEEEPQPEPQPEPTPQPSYPRYYPDYEESQPAAQAPVEQESAVQPAPDGSASPKTGEQGGYVVLAALCAAAAVAFCARKAAMSR